jgi:hypothetical protein
VCSISFDEHFGNKTPARFCFPTPEWACHYFGGITTITFAQPFKIPSGTDVFNSGKPSKTQARFNLESSHFSSPEKHPMEEARQSGVNLMFGFDGLAALSGVYHKQTGVMP